MDDTGQRHDPSEVARSTLLLAEGAADVCNDAGGARWCPACAAAHGAWHGRCPTCGGRLVTVAQMLQGRRPKTAAA